MYWKRMKEKNEISRRGKKNMWRRKRKRKERKGMKKVNEGKFMKKKKKRWKTIRPRIG